MDKKTANDLVAMFLNIPDEDGITEFKRLGLELRISKVVETIVAMANTDGGIIILGVDDPKKTRLKGLDRVFGIEEDPGKMDDIAREIVRISPPIPFLWPSLRIPCENGRTIGVLQVMKATNAFHSIDNRVFVRQEKGNRLLTPHEIISFSYAKGFSHADRELVDVDFDLLDTAFYEKWRAARKLDKDEVSKVLYHTGLARKDSDGVLKPTRAAVLLFAEHPNDLMQTKCTIRIFQYEGTIEKIKETLNLIGTPLTIEGPVLELINIAHDRILTLLRSGMRIPGSGFVTSYLIPDRAVKEAITNAVIHRDYFIKRDIEVRLFEDRLEIESPGLFPYNITPFNIGSVRADGYRNDLVVKHLREFPEPPNLDQNEGVRAMRSQMYERNLYPPVFFTYPYLQDSVRVVLFNSIRATEWDKVSNYLAKQEKYVTNEKVRKILDNPDTSRVSKLLKKWVEQGLLAKFDTGAKKTVKYRLPVDEERESLFSNKNTNKN
jgi:ATP-dependent DNA helicase RecG